MSGVNPLEMSDEDFAKLNDPGGLPPVKDQGPADPETMAAAQPVAGDPVPGSSEAEPAPVQAASEPVAASEGGAADPTGAADGGAAAGETTTPTPETKPEGEAAGAEAGEAAEAVTIKAEDAQAFYQKVMAPFKANGKTIQLKDPDEAVTLMQMGANYTRRMQELAPHRKTLLMLQNNNLLDPEKLSFLIDLDKGDPEAIKKFVKDRGIDPMEIDTSTDPAYLGGNHEVTDQQLAFTAALEELSSTPAGQATLSEINGSWDDASKEELWKHPEALRLIQEQRETGVYDLIAAEVSRQRTLGKLNPSVPFIQAYTIVGNQMAAEATSAPALTAPASAPASVAQPQVLATRVEAPKSPVSASEQAAAASPSRGTAAQPQNTNPQAFLAMADEEFMKLDQFKGRI